MADDGRGWVHSDPRGFRRGARDLSAAAGDLSRAQLQWWVIHCWVSTAEEDLGTARWCELFRMAGYTVDAQPADLPTEPLRLYRGAGLTRSDGMAWTTSLSCARKFATSDGARPVAGRLWTTVAQPSALLARWDGRHEREVVVDPRGLDIRPHSTAVDEAMDTRPTGPARAASRLLVEPARREPFPDLPTRVGVHRVLG